MAKTGNIKYSGNPGGGLDGQTRLWAAADIRHLSPPGMAGFVIVNSASDVRSSEQDRRRQLAA